MNLRAVEEICKWVFGSGQRVVYLHKPSIDVCGIKEVKRCIFNQRNQKINLF